VRCRELNVNGSGKDKVAIDVFFSYIVGDGINISRFEIRKLGGSFDAVLFRNSRY
jgi:hypothetical protein